MLKIFNLKTLKIILFILSITTIAFISNPYSFGHSNHGQELPPILAMISGDLYLNDFAVQSYLEINPRYYWQFLITIMHDLFGLDIDETLMLIIISSTISFYAAIFRIAFILSNQGTLEGNNTYKTFFIASYVSILATLPLLSWASKIFYIEAVPSTLAMGIAIWSIYFALKNKWILAYIFSGISIFMHFLVGLYAGLVIFPFLALYTIRNIKVVTFLSCVTIWLIPAFYIYLSMLQLETESIYQYDLFEVFGTNRVPHHWIPSTGSIYLWFSDFILLVISLYCSKQLYDLDFNKNIILFLLSIITVALCGLTLNYIFVEVYLFEFIAKLQFQRILPYGHLAIFFLISLYAVNTPSKKTLDRLKKISFVCIPLIPVIIINYRIPSEPIIAILTILTISLAAVFFYKRYELKKIHGEFILFSIFLTLFVALYFKQQSFEVFDKNLPENRYDYNFFENEDNRSNLSKWLKENTEKNDVILTPPIRRGMHYIQLHAQRAVYFSDKNIPYTKNGIFEWANRLEKLMNRKISPFMSEDEVLKAWALNTTANIQNIAFSNNICFIIDFEDVHNNYSGRIVMKEKIRQINYVLWRLDICME